MQNLKRKNLSFFILIILIIIGSYLRIYSNLYQASYWNDESHVAKYGRAIVETGKAIDATGYGTGLYQSGIYYITAFSFSLFGINEFAGRLPSVLIGISLIPVIYFITKQLFGNKEALIAAILMTFSQMQLAWSTQLRPYIWMELFTLILIYFAYLTLQQKKKIIDKNILYATLISFFSLLFHGTGIFNFVIIGTVFLYKIISAKKYKFLLVLIPVGGLALLVISVTPFFTPYFLFRVNTYLTHYQVFLGFHYGWLGIGSAVGTFYLWKKNKEVAILLAGSATFIILFALFKVHARYVRYSITAFPLIYILFSVGIVELIKTLTPNIKFAHRKFIAILIVGVVFFSFPIYKEKLIFFPKRYYSINADMRENPIVDYKLAFQKIDQLIEGKEDKVAVMDAWYDRIMWYLPEVDNYYLLLTNPDALTPNMIVTIDKFEKVKSQYDYGVVMVENWQSMTPYELQDHVRKTLKHEFDTQTVQGNEKDSWSISVYSWGL